MATPFTLLLAIAIAHRPTPLKSHTYAGPFSYPWVLSGWPHLLHFFLPSP